MAGQIFIPRSVLSISSHVAYGPVGNSAAVPALRGCGLTVHEIPTVILSNHPGLGKPAALEVPGDVLDEVLDRLLQETWLDGCTGILTGYFCSADQVAAAAKAIRIIKTRNPACIYLCDPVLGDDHTGLYVPGDVADAIKSELAGLADAVSPNRYELEWMTGHRVSDISSAQAATDKLECPLVLATSLPCADQDQLTTAVFQAGSFNWVSTARHTSVPQGTGDLLSGLFLAALVLEKTPAQALARSVAQLDKVIDASRGSDVLNLTQGLSELAGVEPLPLQRSEPA